MRLIRIRRTSGPQAGEYALGAKRAWGHTYYCDPADPASTWHRSPSRALDEALAAGHAMPWQVTPQAAPRT